jgi:hypothetical protein
MTELAIIVGLVALGAVTAAQEIRIRRWDPDFFRRGVLALRTRSPLAVAPAELSFPPGVRAHRFGPHEIAFVAPVLNGSLMRGLLRYKPEASSLEVVGYLQWGICGLFVVPALFMSWPLGLGVLLWFFCAYLGERRRFLAALQATVRPFA